MGPWEVLRQLVGADKGVMEIKGYSTFPKVPGVKPPHQIV